MKIIQKILKILIIFLLLIIPIFLISYSMFVDFIGCYLMVNKDSKLESLLEKEGVDSKNIIVVFLDTDFKENNHVIVVNKNLTTSDIKISTNKLVEYMIINGIDVYNAVTVISYMYIIIVAIIIFFKKLLENADKYNNFQERDN